MREEVHGELVWVIDGEVKRPKDNEAYQRYLNRMSPLATYALASDHPVTDEIAAFALGEFFQAVLETDGPGELRRIYAAFYRRAHGEDPAPIDWSDKTGDGELRVRPPAMTAVNGR